MYCLFKILDEEEPVKQAECTFKLSFIYGLFVMLVWNGYQTTVWYNIVEVSCFLYWLWAP